MYLIILGTYFFAYDQPILAACHVSDDIGLLKKKLHDKNKDVRSAAAAKLGAFGKKAVPAIPDLIEALNDVDHAVREDAKSALYEIGKPAVPLLSKALQGNNFTIRKVIPSIFFMLGPKARSAIPALLATLKDPDPTLRYEAAYALFRVRDDKAIPALIEVARSDSDDGVRMEALGALSHYEGAKVKSALPLLIHIVEKDRNTFLGNAAGDVLVEIGSDAVPALAQTLTNPDNRRVARASAGQLLGRIGPAAKNALPSLMEALADPDKHVRFRVIEALGELGPNAKAAAPMLMKVTKDKLAELRVQAALSLYNICPTNEVTLPTLIEALKGLDTIGRGAAARGLAEVGPQAKNAIPELIAALKDKDPKVRIAADLTLKEIRSRRDQ